jgi:hypothetical protein
MTFDDFVTERIKLEKGEEREPFCVFRGYQKVGYCDASCTNECYYCCESMYEYMKEHYDEGTDA